MPKISANTATSRFDKIALPKRIPFPLPFRSISVRMTAYRFVEGKMPKQKTHKGIKKRFKVTATGKAMHRHSGTSHLAYRITKKRRRNLRGTTVVAKAETSKIVNALIPSK